MNVRLVGAASHWKMWLKVCLLMRHSGQMSDLLMHIRTAYSRINLQWPERNLASVVRCIRFRRFSDWEISGGGAFKTELLPRREMVEETASVWKGESSGLTWGDRGWVNESVFLCVLAYLSSVCPSICSTKRPTVCPSVRMSVRPSVGLLSLG